MDETVACTCPQLGAHACDTGVDKVFNGRVSRCGMRDQVRHRATHTSLREHDRVRQAPCPALPCPAQDFALRRKLEKGRVRS